MSAPTAPTRRQALQWSAAAMLSAPALIKANIVNAATLDNDIGRLIMIGFAGKHARGNFARSIANHVRRGRASSVVFLAPNVGGKRDVQGLTKLFHDAGATHIAIDHEGGAVQRLREKQGFTRIPSALSLAQSRDAAGAQKVYEIAARELAAAGFTLNLGPVADLHRAYNPVIGRNKRAYSSNPAIVAKYAATFVLAHRKHGLRTALKHFPGHGLSRSDSHHGFVDIRATWQKEELMPFKLLIARGLADIIMTGHLFMRMSPNDNGELATFSRTLVQDVLRQGLGFDGPAMTDDLDMGAVSKVAKPKEAAVRAIEAGYDMLLLSNTRRPDADLPAEAVRWIAGAVREGRIREEQIFASAQRVRASGL